MPINKVLYFSGLTRYCISAGNGVLSLPTKRPEREVDHLRTSNFKIRNECSCIAVALHDLMTPTRTVLSLPFAFQYLQLRFNRSVRVMASVLFTISVLLYVPLVIYVPALALSYGKNSWQYYATGNFGTLEKSEATGVFV